MGEFRWAVGELVRLANQVLAGGSGQRGPKASSKDDRRDPPPGVAVLRTLSQGETVPLNRVKDLAQETHALAGKARKAMQRTPGGAHRLPARSAPPSARAYGQAVASAQQSAAAGRALRR